MKEIKDKKLLEKYLEQYQIRELFDTQNLPFQLFEYEKGEMMNVCHPPTDYLKFLVKGEWNLVYDSSEGRRIVVKHIDKSIGEFFLLGDFELCCERYENNWQEVRTVVHSIEIPLHNLREILLNDNRFLRFMLRNVYNKILIVNPVRDGAMTLEEKVLYYLRYESKNHSITNVKKSAEMFHNSRRQLHRVLKKLMDEGIVEHCTDGYKLYF